MSVLSLTGRLRKDTGVAGAREPLGPFSSSFSSSIEPAIPMNTSADEYERRRQAREMSESGSSDAQARFVRDLESKSSK